MTAIIYVLPTFQPGLWPHNQINLGLDLQGGMHLVLEVDTAKAVEGQVERISQEVLDQLKKERIRKVSLDRIDGTKIAARINDPEIRDKFNELLKSQRKLRFSEALAKDRKWRYNCNYGAFQRRIRPG